MILLDGSSLSLEQLRNIADGAERVGLTPEARTRVRASREVVERRARGDEPAYGINTGFGSFADVKIARGALETLQLNLLRSHAAGVGDPLPVRAVRATMALRANVLAKGFSGISIETLDALIALVNNDVHPRVPPLPRTTDFGGQHRAPDARQRHQRVARVLRQDPGRLLDAVRATGARRGPRSAPVRPRNRRHRG